MAERLGTRSAGHLLIALEGSGGSGKTAIRRHLYEHFRARDEHILTINQHSWLDIPATAAITACWGLGVELAAVDRERAYVIDKVTLGRRLIKPHLQARHVLSDRYVASDLVYNHSIWGAPIEPLAETYVAAGVPLPDLTIYVDTPPDATIARLRHKHPDQFHWYETDEMVVRMYAAFEHVLFSGSLPTGGPCVRIDGTAPIEDQVQLIDRAIERSRTGHGAELVTSPTSGSRP